MILISKRVHEQAAAYCRKLLPEEGCGVFHGIVESSGTIRITGWSPVGNAAEDRIHSFAFHKQQWLELLFEESDNHRLIGTFHSHPGGRLSLSVLDRAGLWALPTSWIVSFSAEDRPLWQAYGRTSSITSYKRAQWSAVDDIYA